MSDSNDALRKHFRYADRSTGDEVIDEERNRVVARRRQAQQDGLLNEDTPSKPEDVKDSLTGLALSGGGIRSGAMCLGVLQALHRTGLLPFFDYLSTVSGGGYAGGYLSSAATRTKNDSDDHGDSGTPNPDSVPCGHLTAFHDGRGLSERMKEFIFGGNYLFQATRFFNRYLIGLVLIWLVTLSSITTLALIAAIAFRSLDDPAAADFLSGLGCRTDVTRGFFPVVMIAGIWLLLWVISYFQKFGESIRAQGLLAGTLLPAMAVAAAISVASLLGNGEFNLDWLSGAGGFEAGGIAKFMSESLGVGIYSLIGVGLVPYLIPGVRKNLLRSGAAPKSRRDRLLFKVTSRMVVYGVPFVFVSWFAQEDLANWSESRPVTANVSRLYTPEELKERAPYAALTRSEIRSWSPWLTEWAPFWKQLVHYSAAEQDWAAANQDEEPVPTRHNGIPLSTPKPGPANLILNALNDRITPESLPELPPATTKYGAVPTDMIPEDKPELLGDVMQILHNEFDQIQSLYYCEYENGNQQTQRSSAGFRFMSRMHSVAVLIPNSLLDKPLNNPLNQFAARWKRSRAIQDWLAEQVSNVLETTDLSQACLWDSTFERLNGEEAQALRDALEQARIDSVDTRSGLVRALDNRRILAAAFPGTLQKIGVVYASNVLTFDQARRWTLLKWSFATWFLLVLLVNVNASSLHGYYSRELANNWLQTGTGRDLRLSDVDPTSRGLPYHLISSSVHWVGRRRSSSVDPRPVHFLLSPMYCGSERTGFVPTSHYADDQIGLSDAIAISGAAISPVHQTNPMLQALLWLANLRLGLWLPNPAHGTFLPRDIRKLCDLFPVTPLRLMSRMAQKAEDRPFLFVTDGGLHENLGIGPLLERRCRFIVAIDAGEDPNFEFSDLEELMRWARVKHDVQLRPVDSDASTNTEDDAAAENDHVHRMKSSIDAWNELAPGGSARLDDERKSARHFVVLRLHYPDVDGPSWLIYAKTSLTGDEPVEMIRYAERDKNFPHNPTSNQFYTPETFESYRQLGEHITESIIGRLPQLIQGKLAEHKYEPYLAQLLTRVVLAQRALSEKTKVAPLTPAAEAEVAPLLNRLCQGDLSKTEAETIQKQLDQWLTWHPQFVERLVTALILSRAEISERLAAFVFQTGVLDGRKQALQQIELPDGFELEAGTKLALGKLNDDLTKRVGSSRKRSDVRTPEAIQKERLKSERDALKTFLGKCE